MPHVIKGIAESNTSRHRSPGLKGGTCHMAGRWATGRSRLKRNTHKGNEQRRRHFYLSKEGARLLGRSLLPPEAESISSVRICLFRCEQPCEILGACQYKTPQRNSPQRVFKFSKFQMTNQKTRSVCNCLRTAAWKRRWFLCPTCM